MNAPAQSGALVTLLERELGAQRAIASILDRALEAAVSRSIERLEPALGELDAASRRVRALAAEREGLVASAEGASLRANPKQTPTLRELAERPGAPRERLLGLREELRAATGAVADRVRRLQPLVRELGEVHALAFAALLQTQVSAAPGPRAQDPGLPMEVRHGALVDTEA
jgi:hypothetical protein